MGDEVVLEATFLLFPLLMPPTFLGMGVVGDGLFDTGFFLVGVACVLLGVVVLLSPVLDPGGDFRPAGAVFDPVGEALPDDGGDTVGFFVVGLEVTEILLGT